MKNLLLASMIATVMTATPVWASENTADAKTETTSVKKVQREAGEVLHMAGQGFDAMRDIQLARVAIFQGHTGKAENFIANATTLLSDTSTDWSKFTKMDHKAKMINDQYIIINSNFSISENFVASPEKEAAIKKANEKISEGDPKGAVDTLRLAGMSVVQNQYLMPLQQTRHAVAETTHLLNTGKYYEANLMLKSAEDGIVVESQLIDLTK